VVAAWARLLDERDGRTATVVPAATPAR
jgi:hypothetical protein